MKYVVCSKISLIFRPNAGLYYWTCSHFLRLCLLIEAFAFDQSKLIKSLKITHQALKGIQVKISKEKDVCTYYLIWSTYVITISFRFAPVSRKYQRTYIPVAEIHAKNRRSLRQAILGYRPIGKIHQWAEPWTNICLHLANFLDLSIVLRTVLKKTEMTPEINMKD